MAVNSVTTGNMAALQSLNAASSSGMPAHAAAAPKDQLSNRAPQAAPREANTDNIQISPTEKQTPKKASVVTKAVVANSSASGSPSHVLVTYNPQGKKRTKFLDSRNDVVYQVPPEMLAKLQDLMMKPETSANIRG